MNILHPKKSLATLRKVTKKTQGTQTIDFAKVSI